MSPIFAIVLLAATVCCALGQRENLCPGNYRNGERVNRGRYWYECQNGQLVPKGCFSDKHERINLGESFISTDGAFALKCVKDQNGNLEFVYKACVYQNYEYQPGQTWQDDRFWYKCEKDGDNLRVKMAGCLYDGRRYMIGDVVEKGDFYYQCRSYSNGTCRMCPSGCVSEGRRYKIGESFAKGQFHYACTLEQGRVMEKCIGCVHNGRRMEDGEHYEVNGALFQCAIHQGDNSKHELIGCADWDNGVMVKRLLGCFWKKGIAPYQYVMKCEKVDDKTVVKKPVHCFYGMRDGGYELDPGCFQIDENKLIVACLKTNDIPRIETFPVDQIKDTYLKGLRNC